MKQDHRGSWYLLTGAILGIAMGLVYSWVISPVQYVDAPPYALRADFKDDYRVLVAAAYMYNHDLLRAEDRLAQLKDGDPAQSLTLQAQRAFEQGHPQAEVRALGILALELGQGLTPQVPSTTPAPFTAYPSAMDTVVSSPIASQPPGNPSITPQPGLTQEGSSINVQLTQVAFSTPAQGSPYAVEDSTLICNPDQPEPMIQVFVQDAAGNPVPDVELVVAWENGEDHFFTGLQPELGMGYADFLMAPGAVYSFALAGSEPLVTGLAPSTCQTEDGQSYWGSWLLTIIQP